MVVIYARLLNQNNFKHHTYFQQDFINSLETIKYLTKLIFILILDINQKIIELNIIKIDVESQLERQIQTREIEDSDWIFDKNESIKINFHKTTGLKG